MPIMFIFTCIPQPVRERILFKVFMPVMKEELLCDNL